jgi:hypothetical protein
LSDGGLIDPKNLGGPANADEASYAGRLDEMPGRHNWRWESVEICTIL